MRLIKRFRLRGVEFPIYEVQPLAALVGTTNGKIPDEKLAQFPLAQGGEGHLLAGVVYRAWLALQFIALVTLNAQLTATSPADTYRSYPHQERGFTRRFTPIRIPTRDKRMWNGVWWYRKPGNAGMAVPGSSNHGRAIAIDHAIWNAVKKRLERSVAWLTWFAPVAVECGWSWEAPSEDWHIRYVAGDTPPKKVLDVTRMLAAPALGVGSSGKAVIQVQQIVGAVADGKFGVKTQAAVIEWQKAQTSWYGGAGLSANGTWDADDWYAAGVVPS